MAGSMICLFILGGFIAVTGVVTLAAGWDQRHWGAVAVFIGAVLCVTAAVVLDGVS